MPLQEVQDSGSAGQTLRIAGIAVEKTQANVIIAHGRRERAVEIVVFGRYLIALDTYTTSPFEQMPSVI